jgi:hypothetical protein
LKKLGVADADLEARVLELIVADAPVRPEHKCLWPAVFNLFVASNKGLDPMPAFWSPVSHQALCRMYVDELERQGTQIAKGCCMHHCHPTGKPKDHEVPVGLNCSSGFGEQHLQRIASRSYDGTLPSFVKQHNAAAPSYAARAVEFAFAPCEELAAFFTAAIRHAEAGALLDRVTEPQPAPIHNELHQVVLKDETLMGLLQGALILWRRLVTNGFVQPSMFGSTVTG